MLEAIPEAIGERIDSDQVPYELKGTFVRLSFLQKVKVKRFVESHVVKRIVKDKWEKYTSIASRVLIWSDNYTPNDIFYVIGQSHRCQGTIEKGYDEEPNYLNEKSRHYICTVANKLNHKYNVLLDDIELVEDIKELAKDMKKFTIIFYNRFGCETQRFQTEAKNKLCARHLFWKQYPRQIYLDCIENIYED
jgi:hypothetical protein